ncbi:MAG: GC-type dockerin domain-anchored protein [Phycisphaerales bacterium JB039]
MQKRTNHVIGAAIIASLAPLAMADEALTLQAAHPGARIYREATGAVVVYGVPMRAGADPVAAAAGWLDAWGGVFDAGALELTLDHATPIRDGRFTALLYSQTIDGLPVDGGLARVLVLNDAADAGLDRVVYAAGRLAPRPEGGFEPIRTAPADVIGAAGRMVSFAHLTEWSAPELVVFADRSGEDVVSRRAWRFTGHTEIPRHDAWEFVMDAASGRLLDVRPAMHHTDVDGKAEGLGSPGTAPDIASNPEVAMPMPRLDVSITGGAGATTAPDGSFTIPHGGTSPVTVTGGVAGQFIRVDNLKGAEITDSVIVTPPGPADLLLNDVPSEFTTAQVNAYVQATRTHDLIKDRAPGFTGLDLQLLANINSSDSCNAFFTTAGLRIEFFNAAGGCVNTAYSTVVSHEYGHFVVNRLGLAQGAFGEGYGDSIAIMLFDTGIVGEQFFGPGSGAIRNPEAARQQVDCTAGIHTCGQQLGGTWRWIRNNIGTTRGSAEGIAIARDLFVGWSMITLGGAGSDAISDRTAIEVLTIDDDDGTLENGTPNYPDICAAFDRHGVACPPISLLSFSFPDGQPELLTPGAPTNFRVTVSALTEAPQPGTGQIFVRTGGSFIPLAMTETAPNEYIAEIPGAGLFTQVDYYVAAETTTGKVGTSPAGAPGGFRSAIAGVELVRLDFETADGWTVENIDLLDGAWQRAVPAGGGDRGDPIADFDGSGRCWVTDNADDNSDVDGGPTRLISPVYDLAGVTAAQVSYARWFQSSNGVPDRMTVEVSNNGGTNWTQVESVGDGADWALASFIITDFVPLTDQVRVRFNATDNPNDSVTEAGIDRFWLLTDGDATCRVDLTGDGSLDFFDFLEFQNLFGAGDLKADFTGDGVLDFFDFLAFQNEFAAGCP